MSFFEGTRQSYKTVQTFPAGLLPFIENMVTSAKSVLHLLYAPDD
jgi:hypothetical protein